MTRRAGATYRIHDWWPFGRGPLVLALDHSAHGGVFSPRASVHWHGGRGYRGGWSVHLDVPHLRWATAWRWRRAGLLTAYRCQYRLVMALFR